MHIDVTTTLNHGVAYRIQLRLTKYKYTSPCHRGWVTHRLPSHLHQFLQLRSATHHPLGYRDGVIINQGVTPALWGMHLFFCRGSFRGEACLALGYIKLHQKHKNVSCFVRIEYRRVLRRAIIVNHHR